MDVPGLAPLAELLEAAREHTVRGLVDAVARDELPPRVLRMAPLTKGHARVAERREGLEIATPQQPLAVDMPIAGRRVLLEEVAPIQIHQLRERGDYRIPICPDRADARDELLQHIDIESIVPGAVEPIDPRFVDDPLRPAKNAPEMVQHRMQVGSELFGGHVGPERDADLLTRAALGVQEEQKEELARLRVFPLGERNGNGVPLDTHRT